MTEQRDYSGGSNSPQQHTHIMIGGGVILGAIALAFALMAFGGVILMGINQAANMELLSENIEAKAAAAAAPGVVRAQIAERESRVAIDTTQRLEVGLAKRGIVIK